MTAPYLSVVVTSRNDGHGGDPLGRLQAFVDTFAAQCRRFGLDAELVVVDWNPPPERPRLHQVVAVPTDCPFAVRFIEVPAALHNSLPHPTVMPLFQMIGKNVGARRARGEFVLCSNIDIILSNELVQFLASRTLQPGVLYRVDRHDIESDYPADAPLDQQLAYCRSHHLRVHRAWGTFPTDAAGRLVPAAGDIFGMPSVTIGDGWHVREGDDAGGYYRWASATASVVVTREPHNVSGVALELDLEPNPYDPASWVDLEVRASNAVLARTRIDDRRQLWVPLPAASGPQEIVLNTRDASAGTDLALPPFERRRQLAYRVRTARLAPMPAGFRASPPYDASRWRAAHRDASIEANPNHLRVRSAAAQHTYAARFGPLYAPRRGCYTFVADCTCLEGNVSMHLVDEAADRFVAGREFEIAERDRRLIVVSAELGWGQPCGIYIANRHRGGDRVSQVAVHALYGSVPMSELQARTSAAGLAGRARRFSFKVARGGTRRLAALFQRSSPGSPAGEHRTPPGPAPSAAAGHENAGPTARIEAFMQTHRLPPVHRNAAGDFQLMARRHWFELQGYAEFTMYSMNVDGLLGDVAYHSGIREETLPLPCCIYHLEHTQGSGWTPEGEELLRKRLAASGADWLDATTVDLWSAYMDWLKRPMLFNPAGWGFGDEVLPEVTVAPASAQVDA